MWSNIPLLRSPKVASRVADRGCIASDRSRANCCGHSSSLRAAAGLAIAELRIPEGALRRYRSVSASDGKSARSWPPPGALDSILRGASDRLVRQHLGRQNDS